MIQRITTAIVLIPLALVLVLFSPAWVFLPLIGVLILICQKELFQLLSRQGVQSYRLTFAVSLLLPWVWSSWPSLVTPYLLFASFSLFGWCVFATAEMPTAIRNVSSNLLVFLYIGLPLSLGVEYQSLRPRQLILILITIWVSDSAAYLVGRKWGTRKITPRVSPNKSLQGFLAGGGSAPLAVLLLGGYLLPQWTTVQLLGAGLVLAVSGLLGDLFESVLKRSVGVKDSSQWIPGHGGVLDRLDSLLFVLPAYHLLVILLEWPATPG